MPKLTVNTNPVIYLDIDGVLNYPSMPESGRIRFGPGNSISIDKFNLLHQFITDVNASVVIVSSWAIPTPAQKICNFLEVPYHSDAFHCGGGLERGRGVALHSEENHINNYVILDDAWRQMYEDWSHCVRIDGKRGLTDRDITKAFEMLEVQNNELKSWTSKS